MSDTGNSATIAFGTSGFTALYQEIGEMTNCSSAAAYRRFQAHLAALSRDPSYAAVARRALNET